MNNGIAPNEAAAAARRTPHAARRRGRGPAAAEIFGRRAAAARFAEQIDANCTQLKKGEGGPNLIFLPFGGHPACSTPERKIVVVRDEKINCGGPPLPLPFLFQGEKYFSVFLSKRGVYRKCVSKGNRWIVVVTFLDGFLLPGLFFKSAIWRKSSSFLVFFPNNFPHLQGKIHFHLSVRRRDIGSGR